MASATAFLQSRTLSFITTPIAEIGDINLTSALLACVKNNIIAEDFLKKGSNTISGFTNPSYSSVARKQYAINTNTPTKQIYAHIKILIYSFLKCEDFICALKNHPGGFAVSIPIIHDYICANEKATTASTNSGYYKNNHYQIAEVLVNSLRNYLIILYNATKYTDYYFSFNCVNTPNDVILWIWQILGRLRHAPYDELVDYVYSFNSQTGSARIDTWTLRDGTKMTKEGFFPLLEHVIEYMKNKYSDIIIDQFGDLNPPAFADMRTFALAGQTNISTGSNKKLQVNNNQIIKICQGENVILDLTN